jgi:hypothetical protein
MVEYYADAGFRQLHESTSCRMHDSCTRFADAVAIQAMHTSPAAVLLLVG